MRQKVISVLIYVTLPTSHPMSTSLSHIINQLQTRLLHVQPCISRSSKFQPHLKPYWKKDNLQDLHYDMRCKRRFWIENGKSHSQSDSSYASYKKAKRIFRRQHRKSKQSLQIKDLMKFMKLLKLIFMNILRPVNAISEILVLLTY